MERLKAEDEFNNFANLAFRRSNNHCPIDKDRTTKLDDILERLSEDGIRQYMKYFTYYASKYEELNYSVEDIIVLIESDAKVHKEYKNKS